MIKPVKRIALSEKDIQCGRMGSKSKTQNTQPQNYRDHVVVKPWGHEFLVFENEWVAIWFLRIRKDHATSMHSHPSKKTSLALLSGKALCNTFYCRSFLNPGDALIVEPAVFHSTKALSLDGIQLIEVETPPGKLDLLRLEDNYGRQDRGYEGCSQMITVNLEAYDFFNIDENGKGPQVYRRRDDSFSIDGEQYASAQEFNQTFVPDPGSLYCLCRGEIRGGDSQSCMSVGEIQKGGYLEQGAPLRAMGPTLMLRFKIYS